MRRNDHVYVPPNAANGIALQLSGRPDDDRQVDDGDAYFDHVAVRVRDLIAASTFWEQVVGTDPLHMGIHPRLKRQFQSDKIHYARADG